MKLDIYMYGLNGWGIYDLRDGTFMTEWVGHLLLKWVGQSLQVIVSFGKMLKKMLKMLVFRDKRAS